MLSTTLWFTINLDFDKNNSRNKRLYIFWMLITTESYLVIYEFQTMLHLTMLLRNRRVSAGARRPLPLSIFVSKKKNLYLD